MHIVTLVVTYINIDIGYRYKLDILGIYKHIQVTMCHLFDCARTMRHAAAETARDNLREWRRVAPEKDGGAARRPPPSHTN